MQHIRYEPLGLNLWVPSQYSAHATNHALFDLCFCMNQIREKEEDIKILEYIRAKDAREQEVAFEKERVRHEKEMETVRLRTMQV